MGVGAGAVVGVCMPRSPDTVATLVGIQKVRAAYVPLDPDFPVDRLSFMLADSGAHALVTNGFLPSGLSVPAGVKQADLAAQAATIGAHSPESIESAASPADLAYIIYTSGSTGRPKGVRISQAALSNFLGAMRHEPGMSPSDVLAAVTTISFDIAGLELYLPLVAGSCIELVSREEAANGPALVERMARCGATVMQATPSTWRMLLEAGWNPAPGFRAICGGEALPRDLADALLTRVSELWNMYGPTETTIWSTAQRVEPGEGPVPIGRPIANTHIYIMNRSGHPLPVGVPGEIWIGGAGVAEGYHGRSELTAERFVPDRFSGKSGARLYRTGDLGKWWPDGRLEHLGRIDNQVKIRGYRIELGEIEAVLATHPAIAQATVVARDAGVGDRRLIAYVRYQGAGDLTASEVRKHLRQQLPDYMIPSVVVPLESMPLTPNGKIDRAALPDPFHLVRRTAAEYVAPAPGLEQTLAEIWREVLAVDRVSADDNFFELGGHSLLSLRVAVAAEKRLGWRMDPRVLFFQTLRQIAGAAATNHAAGTNPDMRAR
jgi:amino acid adenylation domain-containing protein